MKDVQDDTTEDCEYNQIKDDESRVIIGNVSAEAWNKYATSENTKAKYLWYCASTKQVFHVEIPTAQHECTAQTIAGLIDRAADVWVVSLGSTTFRGSDGVSRQPDACFIPNAQISPTPAEMEPKHFVTFVVEVGVTQTWEERGGLHDKAREWFSWHPTVQCVLLVHVSPGLRKMEAELWNRITPTAGQLVNARMNIRTPGGHQLQIETRSLLGIPVGQPLPVNIPQTISIDLAMVSRKLNLI